jgi:hypothetical protein
MLKYTNADVVQAFQSASNINAAVKKFLKMEGDANPRAARFAKSLRDAFTSKLPTIGVRFIDTYRDQYEIELFALAKYVYGDQILAISNQVIDKYSDEFNTTYTVANDKISVTNRKRFDEIVKEVFVIIEASLKAASMPQSPFIKNTLIYSIFDPIVAEEAIKLNK